MNVLYDIGATDWQTLVDEDKKNILEYPEELSFLNKSKIGTLNLICAQSGLGKSWFLSQFAACMSEKYSILYISLENDIGTDAERFVMLQSIYPAFKTASNAQYLQYPIWDNKEVMDVINTLPPFDIVCIDGLETKINCSTDNMFEAYKQEIQKIRDSFPKSCVWCSWQLTRNLSDKEPSLADVSASIAVARLAYSAAAIYKDKKTKQRLIINIKGRASDNDTKGTLNWGQHFAPTNKQSSAERKKVTTTLNALKDMPS